jgi:hypothetical protein
MHSSCYASVGKPNGQTKQVRETEAEAVAFVVCQAAGLQTGTASQDYIQIWHGDANLLREAWKLFSRPQL